MSIRTKQTQSRTWHGHLARGPESWALAPTVSLAGIPHHSTILLFHHFDPMPIVPNKANSPRGAGLRCTNKPNLADRPGSRRAKCAKQSQTWAVRSVWGQRRASSSRQTKPMARSGAPRRCLDYGFRIADCGFRTALRRDSWPVGPAPAGLSGGAKCAKQTQWAGANRAKRTQSCETNPIQSYQPAGRPGPGRR